MKWLETISIMTAGIVEAEKAVIDFANAICDWYQFEKRDGKGTPIPPQDSYTALEAIQIQNPYIKGENAYRGGKGISGGDS